MPPDRAEYLSDFYVFDTSTYNWTDLTNVVSGTLPTYRYCPGFTAIGTQIYLMGGFNGWGEN